MGKIVNCVAYCAGRRVEDVSVERIGEVLNQTDRFIWIGLHEPEEAMLRQIQQAFGLHDLAVEDALSAHQRPKVEAYGDNLFVVLRTANIDGHEPHVAFGETHIFIGERYIVAVRHGPSLPYTPVRTRVETTPHLLSKGPGFVLYALMDYIVDQYFPVVDMLEQQLVGIEDQVFAEIVSRETTSRIYDLQREMIEVKRVTGPLIDVCNRLMRFDMGLISADTQPYFRDIYDHVVRINEMVDTSRELLTTALEAHFSLTSIAQNEVMKRFASWGAILALPTLVAGIYGMNFHDMPELNWSFGYPIVAAITLISCLFLYIRFKRAQWL